MARVSQNKEHTIAVRHSLDYLERFYTFEEISYYTKTNICQLYFIRRGLRTTRRVYNAVVDLMCRTFMNGNRKICEVSNEKN